MKQKYTYAVHLRAIEFSKVRACKQSHVCGFPRNALISPESLKSLPNHNVQVWLVAYLHKVLLRRGYVNQFHFVISGTLHSFGDLMFGEYE